MRIELSEEQAAARAAFRQFAQQQLAPCADLYDREEHLPAEVIAKMAEQGYLGAIVPPAYGGKGVDMITFGLLHEEIGRGCSSSRTLLTVHSMVAFTLLKLGSKAHKETWLPRLATGQTIGAFALTEPNIGSDARNIETTATQKDGCYILNGRKKWISFGQLADIFIFFARSEGTHIAFLVEKDSPGLSVHPISGMLGTRAAMLAEIHLDECEVPRSHIIGGPGFGMAVAMAALDIGRYSVACGCVGIAQACLDACLRYTATRQQFGSLLKDHQLIRQMITEMVANVQAARLLYFQAGYRKDSGDPATVTDTLVAKYFASKIAMKAAADAVQIHGANGCSEDYPVQRFFRDAKVMEIIEGSTQIQELTIAKHAYEG